MANIEDDEDYMTNIVRDAYENPRIHQGMIVSCFNDVLREPSDHVGYGRVLKLVYDKFYSSWFCHVLMFDSNDTLCFPSFHLERKTTCKSVTYAILKQKTEMIEC